MGKIIIVGLGPGDPELITRKAQRTLMQARSVFARTGEHACAAVLKDLGIYFRDFDEEYRQAGDFAELAQNIVRTLMQSAQDGDVVYAVPGQGMLGDETVRALLSSTAQVELIPGVDESISLLPADGMTREMAGGAYMTLPCTALEDIRPVRTLPLLVTQLDSVLEAAQTKLWLTDFYGDEQSILYGVNGVFHVIHLYELDRQQEYGYQAMVWVPPIAAGTARYDFYDLADILARLRAPGGCPWDREQTHESLKDCLLEETYEVHEAIDNADMDSLCDELGDVLLQVVFHAQIGREHTEFDVDDVTDAVSRKMIRRHPHIFGGKEGISTAQDVADVWDEIKKQEKSQKSDADVMREVCQTLPSVLLGMKVLGKAAKAGFAWENAAQAWGKLSEELDELQMEIQDGSERIQEELGDAILALVNVGRYFHVNPETAVRGAVWRFIRRFDMMESMAREKGSALADMPRDALLQLWEKAKVQVERA